MKKQDERWEGEAEDAEFGDTGMDIDVDALLADPEPEKTPMDAAVESDNRAVSRGIVGDDERDQYLVEVTTATSALARAHTIAETKQVLAAAEAAELYAKRAGLSEKHAKMAIDLKLFAIRQLGDMLKATEKATGGDAQRTRYQKGTESPLTLSDLGISKKLSSQAQRVSNLSNELFDEIREGDKTIAQAIKEAEGKPHQSQGTGNNEWYTPSDIIEAARDVMSSIDIDPASSDKANETVKAASYYTKEQDGRGHPLVGNLWMNPPFSQPEVSQFVDSVCNAHDAGTVPQACVLVNNCTETVWGQQLLGASDAVCFLSGRVKFLDPEGVPRSGALQGQMVCYLGDSVESFTREFGRFGITFVCDKEGV